MRIVDNTIYLSEMICLLQEHKKIVIPVAGNSMGPFLCGGRDFVMLEKSILRKGDIVLYRRRQGQFVLHRIQKIKGDSFYVIGDAQTVIEGPLALNQICGRVCKIQRKGRWLSKSDFWSWFFRDIWICIIPLRDCIKKGMYFIIHR